MINLLFFFGVRVFHELYLFLKAFGFNFKLMLAVFFVADEGVVVLHVLVVFGVEVLEVEVFHFGFVVFDLFHLFLWI
jgi:hypothetical protein